MLIGMSSMAFGMVLFYSLGMYSIAIFSPFLIMGMILVLLAGCIAWKEQNYSSSPTPSQPYFRDRPPEFFTSDPNTLIQIAEAARAKGILIERQSAENPDEVYRSLRCPTCRYLFDLGKARIEGYTGYCPSCEQGINLQ